MQTAPYPLQIGELLTADALYNMPRFQRPYAWTVSKHLKDYQNDLELLMEYRTDPNELSKLFLGAIIIQESSAERRSTESKTYDVIDGQQRLTTIYLTLLALCEHAHTQGYHDVVQNMSDKFLLSGGYSSKNWPKISPTDMDTNQFKKIFSFIPSLKPEINTERGPEKGKLIDAYKFIKREIIDKTINAWTLEYQEDQRKAFEQFQTVFTDRVIMADITLNESQHDPFEVFDRLNTKGAKLQTLDLIRNEVFRRFPKDSPESQNFYDNHWVIFENQVNGVSSHPKEEYRDKIQQNFFPAYGKCISGKIKKATIVKELVSHWRDMFPREKTFDPEKVVDHMRNYVEVYKIIITGDIPEWITSKKLKDVLLDIHSLEIYRTTYPFIMSCLYNCKHGHLSFSDAANSLRILESFIIRRIYAYQDEGNGLSKNINPLWESTKGVPSLVAKNIHSRTQTFPRDDEFINGIRSVALYGKKKEKYFLTSYEKFLRRDLPEKTYGHFSIESTDHILPKSWKGTGLKEGEQCWTSVEEKDLFNSLVHTWGNLLPMSSKLNSIKSNKPFREFKNDLHQYGRFETTEKWKLLTKDKDEWTLKDIQKRNDLLAEWAITRWPLPKSD